MDRRAYYGLLLKIRDQGVRTRHFMGRRWFIVRALALSFSLVLVCKDDPIDRGLGLTLLGSIVGVVAAEVRYYFSTRRYWPYQKDVLNWEKIETLAKEDT